MTPQELKREAIEHYGNPLIKQKLKEKQAEMSKRRMLLEVPNADVVITNPTHYAVALKYEENIANSYPKCVAKGVDASAETIKRIARENDVEIIENKIVARNLYNQIDIGEYIPDEMVEAIAGIYVELQKIKEKIKERMVS